MRTLSTSKARFVLASIFAFAFVGVIAFQNCAQQGSTVESLGSDIECPKGQTCHFITQSYCGNGICESNEDGLTCADCANCGNSICELGETSANCSDCDTGPSGPICGDGTCESGETCPSDCNPYAQCVAQKSTNECKDAVLKQNRVGEPLVYIDQALMSPFGFDGCNSAPWGMGALWLISVKNQDSNPTLAGNVTASFTFIENGSDRVSDGRWEKSTAQVDVSSLHTRNYFLPTADTFTRSPASDSISFGVCVYENGLRIYDGDLGQFVDKPFSGFQLEEGNAIAFRVCHGGTCDYCAMSVRVTNTEWGTRKSCTSDPLAF